jgi:hypothetical protein
MKGLRPEKEEEPVTTAVTPAPPTAEGTPLVATEQ